MVLLKETFFRNSQKNLTNRKDSSTTNYRKSSTNYYKSSLYEIIHNYIRLQKHLFIVFPKECLEIMDDVHC